jgi:MFS family permease
MPETASTPSQPSSVRRVVTASLAGTSLEWYDFFIYGTAAALVFNELFFPSFDPLVGTLLAFATFAVGFVSRPLGGLIFGHYGDRIGRKNVLVATSSAAVSLYVVAMLVITIVCVLLAPETSRIDLHAEADAAAGARGRA